MVNSQWLPMKPISGSPPLFINPSMVESVEAVSIRICRVTMSSGQILLVEAEMHRLLDDINDALDRRNMAALPPQ